MPDQIPAPIPSAPRPRIWPSLSVLGQVLGLLAFVVGLGGLAGVWWAVLTGGALAVVLGTLAELRELVVGRPAAPARARPSGGE